MLFLYRSIFFYEMSDVKMHDLLCLFAVFLDCGVLLIYLTRDIQEFFLEMLEIIVYHPLEIANFRDAIQELLLLLLLIHQLSLSSIIAALEAAESDVLQLLMNLIFHFLHIVFQKVY